MLYIHATTSAILPFLKQTNYQLISLQTLLLEHGIAPMSGEVFAGGISSISDKVETAFAEIDSQYWQFEKVVKSYANLRWQPQILSSDDLNTKLDTLLKSHQSAAFFSPSEKYLDARVITTLVDCLRHLQMSCLPLLDDTKINEIEALLNQKLANTIQRLQMNYVASRFFMIKKKISYGEYEKISVLLSKLSKNLPLNFLNDEQGSQYSLLKKIIEEESFSLLGDYFELQELEQSGEFNNSHSLFMAIRDPHRDDYIFSSLDFKNQGALINTHYAFEVLQAHVKNSTKACDLLLQTLRQICAYQIPREEVCYIQTPFPIVFGLLDDNALEAVKYEYRATKNLKLGTDITLIATDNDHVQLLSQYLGQNGLTNVTVMSIDELKTYKNDQATPPSMMLR